jgi:hypothetical protein
MIIYNFKDIIECLKIKGVIHIGSHNCEENNFYNSINIKNIIWVDALYGNSNNGNNKINVYNALITDKDNKEYIFNISNNTESSSIFEMKHHNNYYPDIHYVDNKKLISTTIDTFYKDNNIDCQKYDMWNICIQGSELLALLGGRNNIESLRAIYIKIYTSEIYEGCPMVSNIDEYLSSFNFKRVLTEISEFKWGYALYVRYI